MNELNPYSPSEPSTLISVASAEITREPPLHRGLSTLVGLVFGVFFTVFAAGVLTSIAVKSGLTNQIGLGGPLSKAAMVLLLIYVISGGILGGFICGLTIGGRKPLALSLASLPGIAYLVVGLFANESIVKIGFLAVGLAASAVMGTFECYLLFRGIDRRRDEVFSILKQDPKASTGATAAVVAMISATCVTIGGIGIALGSLSAIPRPFFSGLTAGVGLFGISAALFLWAAYPNHQRLGLITTLVCVAATSFAFVSQLSLEG